MLKPGVHLFRGAPSVRSWSKYQETIEAWTLCGIKRKNHGKGYRNPASCVEDASLVTCPFCLVLMRPSAKSTAKADE